MPESITGNTYNSVQVPKICLDLKSIMVCHFLAFIEHVYKIYNPS